MNEKCPWLDENGWFKKYPWLDNRQYYIFTASSLKEVMDLCPDVKPTTVYSLKEVMDLEEKQT